MPVFKKGDSTDCNSYRSLFVSSHIGKALHSIYRRELGRVFVDQRLQMQLGGLEGQSIAQASHALRLFHTSALREGESCAFLFIDIQSAFYRLLRQHLIECAQDARNTAELFKSLGLPSEAFLEFQELCSSAPALDSSTASPFLKSLFQEFYSTTWYSVEGTPVLTQTRRGSRPGDSFADICFGFVLCKILRRTQQQLVADFPFLQMTWNGSCCPHTSLQNNCTLGPLMPIWADDVALAVRHQNASVLLDVLPKIAAQVLHSLAAAGLRPNLKPGKTEIVVELRGPGSLRAKRQWMEMGHQLHLQSPLLDQPLRAVYCYKHLGTYIQQGAKLTKDLSVKFAVAHDTFTKFRAQIFNNRSLKLKTKVQYFKSLILSTITFSCAIWEMETKRQKTQMQKGFHRLYKRLTWSHFGHHAKEWSFDHVRATLELPHPDDVCREARLRYIMQLVRHGQPHTWALIQLQGSWFAQVRQDLEWLQAFCPEHDIPTGEPDDWWKAEDWALHHPRQWKRVIRKAVARAVNYHTRIYDWKSWHAEIQGRLLLKGFGQPEMPQKSDSFWCLACKKVFCNRAAMTVHSFKKHGRIQIARYFVEGQDCLCCLKKYGSYVSLVNHVKRTQRCLQFYQTRPTLAEPTPGVNSRQARKASEVIRLPYLQAEGPLEAPIDPNAPYDPQIRAECTRLRLLWDAALALRDQDASLEQLRRAAGSTFLYPDELLATFKQWHADFDEAIDLLQLGILQLFQTHFSYEWLTGEHIAQDNLAQKSMDFFEHHAHRMTTLHCHVARVPKYSPRVFAHLFSGHRREGDIQSHLEASGAFALSIDIIFHIEYGDLAKADTFAFFVRALAEDVLLGFIGGPPCETWSRARGSLLPDGRPGPRVVRSMARPMGLLGLTMKEHDQVAFGSRLLGIMLRLMVVALFEGKTAILEHPAEDLNNHNQVCIWRLPVVQTLLRFDQCRRIRVLQGYYGAKSPKPTELLCMNVAENAEQLLLSGRTTPLPKTISIGKGEHGEWLTTSLKEYPKDFCEVLAKVFLSSQHESTDPSALPQWFLDRCEALVGQFDQKASMGQDFHGKKLSSVN